MELQNIPFSEKEISIIIQVCNTEKHYRKSVKSVIQHTYKNNEMIVVKKHD